MSVAASVTAKNQPDAAVLVRASREAAMVPDPDRAATWMRPDTIITFSGGRTVLPPRDPARCHAMRYRRVTKRKDRFVVRDGQIVMMEVWNDSAEHLLTGMHIIA